MTRDTNWVVFSLCVSTTFQPQRYANTKYGLSEFSFQGPGRISPGQSPVPFRLTARYAPQPRKNFMVQVEWSSFPLSKEIILLEVPNFHWLPWLLEVDLISFWCVNRMKEKIMRTAIANVSLYGGISSTPNLLKGLWVSLRKTTSALKIRCSKRGVWVWHQEQHHTLVQYGQDMTRRVSGNPVMILRIWFQRFLTNVQDVSGSKILEPPVASKSSTQKKHPTRWAPTN